MSEPDPEIIGKPCCYCGKPSEGYYAIHEDASTEGPELPLCNAHGSKPKPTCEKIWAKIAAAKSQSK